MALPEQSGTADFLPIVVDALDFGFETPCDLFRHTGEEYVFFAGRGCRFDQAVRDRLKSFGTDVLYIRSEEAVAYSAFLRDSLNRIVKDPAITALDKARAVQTACLDVMRRVFDDPRGGFISQACDVIVPTVSLIVSNDQATECLVRLTLFDHATYIHSTNVGIFSVAVARAFFGHDPNHDMHRLGAGFFLHDLGKCRIPIEIINKPGRLTPQERQVINGHVEAGHRMLCDNGMLTDEARTIILEHHERDDGRGYPRGKTGAEIHPYARICRLADIYEALTSERPYHNQRSTFDALKLMKERVVTDVDQKLFAHFARLFLG
jgi:HD-GYP domain-containing protein (c-di-GMP phosphodiesterase class II)